MKIAIPVAAGRLSAHFGHCDEFAILEADKGGKEVLRRTVQPPT